MILKLGMKHGGMELYKIYINLDDLDIFYFIRSFFILAGNQDRQMSLDEFEIQCDQTWGCRVSCP